MNVCVCVPIEATKKTQCCRNYLRHTFLLDSADWPPRHCCLWSRFEKRTRCATLSENGTSVSDRPRRTTHVRVRAEISRHDLESFVNLYANSALRVCVSVFLHFINYYTCYLFVFVSVYCAVN